jgi:endoglucanase
MRNWTRLNLWMLLAAIGMVVNGACVQPVHGEVGVPAERFSRLARGVNLSHWFAQVYDRKGYTPDHFETYILDTDIDLIRQVGLTHVRLSVEPKPIMDWDRPGELDTAYLAHLDRAIGMILDRDLAVIVDIHPHPDFNAKLGKDAAHRDAFVEFWGKLAKYLSKYDPERVFLEVLNEPTIPAAVWAPLQERAVAAIRANAPQHTIIATGALWTDISDLVKLTPVADRNVVYNFHFYDPKLFTHQGATWGWPTWQHAKGTPYPLTAEAVAKMIETVSDEKTRKELVHHAKRGWDGNRLDEEIARAAEWAKMHGVRITCNEFGVYRQFTNAGHRAQWIADARKAFEKHNVGWTMWDYAGGFGLVTREAGASVLDETTARALGLMIPEQTANSDGQ